MEFFNVNTGFGYYEDQQGRIVAKAQLPPGPHPIKAGFSYTEVADQAELEAIKVYQDQAQVQAAQQDQKITDKLREIAVNELIKVGNWP